MRDFLLRVLASCTASVILFFIARYLRRNIRFLFFFLLARLTRCGIRCIYDNEDRAAADILLDAERSRPVRVLSIRGFRLTSEDRPLSKLLRPDTDFQTLEVLLADPRSAALKDRSEDFAHRAATYVVPAQYQEDVVHSLNILYDAKTRNGKIDIRMHRQPESFRLLFTDEHLYLSFFPKGKSASLSRVYRIPRNTELYNAFEQHYNWVRDHASKEYRGQYK